MKDRMPVIIYLIFNTLIKGAFAMNVTSQPEIDVSLGSDANILLNCTFEKQTGEFVDFIIWSKEKETKDTYRRLAKFDATRTLYYDTDLRNRSNSITFKNGSTSAILNISVVKCEDEGKYQCTVNYIRDNDILSDMSTKTDVYIQVEAEIPSEFSLQPANISLEEYDAVNLSCSANVGSPAGIISIWKQSPIMTELPIALGNSSSLDTTKENCSTKASLMITYNLTRSDNGFSFGCTSKNNLSQNPARNKTIGPRKIFYGPSNVSIVALPYKTEYFVGELIQLNCTSSGNPKPTFKWKFNSTDIVEEKYNLSNGNTTLQFTIKYPNESGSYHCYVENQFNGKHMNKSGSFYLIVYEKNTHSTPTAKETCSDGVCSFMEKCYENDSIATCSMDVWKIISLVFFTLSLILGMTTLILWLLIRKHRLGRCKQDVFQRSTNKFEDFGGYADPKDVKRPYTHIKGENEGRDNPYADPVDLKAVYTSVQKSSAIPVESPSPESSSTTTPENHVNSQDTENKSIQISLNAGNDTDNIQKPPNVYDDAWV